MGCVGVVAGTILAQARRLNFFASAVWLIFAGVVLLIAFWKPRMAFAAMALIAGMVMAFVRCAENLKDENYIRQFYGQTVEIAGVIDGDPETDESGTKLKLKNLRFGGEEEVKNGVIYVSMTINHELARSDELVISGKLSEGFGTYVGYMYRPKIAKWSRSEPGDLTLKWRNAFAERIKGLIPETEVKLGQAYLLGIKSGLPDELDESLRTAGLTHIVVASGAHLSILVGVVRRIFGKVSRLFSVILAVIFILFFMSMVGFTPSIMRAGMMTILSLMMWYVGRKFSAWRLILIVAAVTLLIDPTFLTNLGWLLSFASYAGIMILGPKLRELFYGRKKPNYVAGMVITSIAATAMTLPITLYYFGQISLVSVVANLLILPTLPWVMGLVFLTGVVAGAPGVETVVAWCATRMLDFHIAVVEFFGGMEQFLIKMETGKWQVFLMYIVIWLLVIIWAWRRQKNRKKYGIMQVI